MTNREKKDILNRLKELCEETLAATLHIEFTDVGIDYIKARMPVDSSVQQGEGILHGGASAALCETVGSAGSYILGKDKNVNYRGIELSINHVRAISSGYVYATAQQIHNGKTTQVWDIKVRNDKNQIISFSKFTTIAISR